MNYITNLLNFTKVLLAVLILFAPVEVASAASLELTKEQKEKYYKQYVEIVEEVVADYCVEMGVVPYEEFAEEHWVKPQEFRKLAISMANMESVISTETCNSSYIRWFNTMNITTMRGSFAQLMLVQIAFILEENIHE
ncbi:hypothetical protein [Cytobacillus sp. IB215665]|uniref:hypothetical protein n=1 Tax=Cytobacillus sp. IB215665 TaxID=3097357 RepID=UPI002A18600E|nr:hypothetical protein [Cytobacillus sp. IB215665]MDX8366305.1 hypothetical protein [Cytobacillus sp. IB215665]